jgi:hypothetical protein
MGLNQRLLAEPRISPFAFNREAGDTRTDRLQHVDHAAAGQRAHRPGVRFPDCFQ